MILVRPRGRQQAQSQLTDPVVRGSRENKGSARTWSDDTVEIDPQGNGWSQNPNGTWTNEGSVSRIYSILGKYSLCSEPRPFALGYSSSGKGPPPRRSQDSPFYHVIRRTSLYFLRVIIAFLRV